MKKALFLFSILILMLAHDLQAQSNDRSIALTNVPGLIQNLAGKQPETQKVNGTYSNHHLMSSYSAGIQHIQGVARLADGRYVFSHDTKNSMTNGLLVFSRPNADAVFSLVGNDQRHPSAMQACGNIVGVPMNEGGNSVHFWDGSNPSSPVELAHLKLTGISFCNAVGLVYHEAKGKHYLLLGSNHDDGNATHYLYESNGLPLTNPNCRFQNKRSITCFGSQGGMQLLYDVSGKLYLAATYRNGSGFESINLSEIVFNSDGSFTANNITNITMSNSGSPTDPSPGFRWGGTIVPTSTNSIDVIGVDKTLSYGPAAKYCNVKIWKSANQSVPQNYVTFVNQGVYIANFSVTTTEGKTVETGNLSKGQSKTLNFSGAVTNLKAKINSGPQIASINNPGMNTCYKSWGILTNPKFGEGCN